MLNFLLEIQHGRGICMTPASMDTFRQLILNNLQHRTPLEVAKEELKQTLLTFRAGGEGAPIEQPIHTDTLVGDAVTIDRYYSEDLRPDDQIVNIVYLTGPMTREGDACSYGSIDIRDRMMRAADVAQTCAHIIYTRTPGGMASTLKDFRKAINYCHERGQKVYMFCDGDVASGGAFVAALCDGVYAFNESDEIGSLGMYCAFFTLAPGEKNSYTQEVYREYYASASPDKNKWYRDAVADNMATVEQNINADLAHLLANLKADRPSIKPEHLTGAMYTMKEAMGSLVDGITTLHELAQRAVNEYNHRKGAALPLKLETKRAATPTADTSQTTSDSPTTLNHTNMKTYPNLGQAAGHNTPLATNQDETVTLQAAEADNIEQQLASTQTIADENTELRQQLATAEEAAKVTEQEINDLKAQLATAQATLEEGAHAAQELATAQETLATTQAELATATAAQAELTTQLETAQSEQQTAHEELATATQRIADLEATVADLNNAAGAAPQTGAAPATNGQSVAAPKMSKAPLMEDYANYADFKAANEAYQQALRRQAYGQK